MIRETSIETYHRIKDEGLLSALRWTVYDCLFRKGPLTQMECCRAIDDPNVQDRSLMPRFAELERMGVIKSLGSRTCTVTDNNVLEWDVTKNIPIKTKKNKIEEARRSALRLGEKYRAALAKYKRLKEEGAH